MSGDVGVLCAFWIMLLLFSPHLLMLHFSLVWYTQHHLIDSDFLLSVGHSSNLDPDLLPYICHTPSISTLVISRLFIQMSSKRKQSDCKKYIGVAVVSLLPVEEIRQCLLWLLPIREQLLLVPAVDLCRRIR